MRQNRRLEASIAIADLFQEYFGSDINISEPFLENAEDEKSDLVLKLDRGPELRAEVRLPYRGDIRILHNENLKQLFLGLRNRFEEIFERIKLDSNMVIIESV